MRPSRDERRRLVVLSLLFVTAALALELFANVVSGPLQRALDRLPDGLYLAVLATLLVAAIVATARYERSARRTAQESTADPAARAEPARSASWRPSRRTLVRAGLGVAVTGAVAVAATPRLRSWLSAPDPPDEAPGWSPQTRRRRSVR
ncbi:hypothetical protein [Micromonospora sp. HM5-17]|jgi:hypothetical protein|uniref:hypothetical protein n=1 Tax=Micromonospora sp. HM5-17 TaxID=2487710 RepID=UPI000F4AE1AC|nr:hypothetical protein [Micromonospora sp. HM5-17]ROT31234.1 hypothetical protein EF879_16635 [Micromonospora sp. HM5-17]